MSKNLQVPQLWYLQVFLCLWSNQTNSMRFTSGLRLSHPSSGLYLYVKLSVSFALSKERGNSTTSDVLQFTGKFHHMRSHFNKIPANRIFINLIPQKQIVRANVKIERNFNKQFQRWFPFSTLYIAEMFETDVEFFGTFLLCLTSGFTKCFQTPCKISFP